MLDLIQMSLSSVSSLFYHCPSYALYIINMAKEIKFSADARAAMVRGVDILADTVKKKSSWKIILKTWEPSWFLK